MGSLVLRNIDYSENKVNVLGSAEPNESTAAPPLPPHLASMDVVTGAVGSLISKLGKLLVHEYKLQESVQKKIESLIKELECARIALHKVDGMPPDQLDEHIRIWACEIREASYDMEDEIDTFLVQVDDCHHGEGHSTEQESFFQRLLDTVRGLRGMPSKRRKIAGAIDNIYRRLDEVTQRYGRYTVVDNSITVARPATLDPRLAAMYKEVSELVGIEKSSVELIAMVSPLGSSDETEIKMKKVSIVGVGGLGKTTLAKSVYDMLKVDFCCSAFVPVGRNPDLKKVFRDILIGIDKDKYLDHKITMLDEWQLISELRENLRNKRYLLVIDDIWETKSWEAINLALVENNIGSRVITTTRILEVSREADEVYKLQHLPRDKSEKLFYRRIFGAKDQRLDDQLAEVYDKILKKCAGVPLAIITMASLLAGKSREERIEVCSSIAFCDTDNKQVSDMEWILSLSYYDLPPHLRTCFLYLSVFPEDEIINKDSLILMWIAEGFVHNKSGTDGLFEVGNGYFNELVNRSMIQAVESESDLNIPCGTVIGCRVHDMVLDLLRLKSQEENFVTIASYNYVEATSSRRRVHRLTHQHQNVDHTQMDMGHVRSFIASWCQIDAEFSFGSFTLLRVLALEHCEVGGHGVIYLKHLENLLHLRYLGLRYSRIHEAEEIGALRFLQTLDLKGTWFRNSKLPLSVGLLTQLISLRADMGAPDGVIEKLTSLEQLEIHNYTDTAGQFMKEVSNLKVLRVLHVFGMKDIFSFVDKAMCEAVVLSRRLRHLIVPCIIFSELPSCISPSDLPNLTELLLLVQCMHDHHLQILGQLPELRHLNLRIQSPAHAAKMTVTSNSNGCFLKLRSLTLRDSTVIFVLNQDSCTLLMWGSCVPLTIRNSSTMDLGARKRDNKCAVAPLIMPNLQVLQFAIYMQRNEVINHGISECLPSLQTVQVTLLLDGSIFHFLEPHCISVLETWETALRQEIEGHPKRPTLQILNYN